MAFVVKAQVAASDGDRFLQSKALPEPDTVVSHRGTLVFSYFAQSVKDAHNLFELATKLRPLTVSIFSNGVAVKTWVANPSVIKSIDGMKKRFPGVDEFEVVEVETKPGKVKKLAKMFVPLEDLNDDEIAHLPRDAFADEEWDEISDKLKERIYEIDPKSSARIARLTEILNAMVSDVDEPNLAYVLEYEGDYLHSEIGNFNIWRRLTVSREGEIEEIADLCGVEYEDCQELKANVEFKDRLEAAIENTNNWDEAVDGDGFHHDISTEYRASIYYEFSDDERLEGAFDDEVDEAFSNAGRAAKDYIDKERLVSAMRGEKNRSGRRDWTYEDDHQYETGVYAVADINWQKVADEVREAYGYSPREEVAPALPPEERVIMHWPNGDFVLDLIPSELAAEGAAMGFCIGQRAHGYVKALEDGEIRLLSLRRANGKPLLTFEIGLHKRDKHPWIVHQVHGRGNRLPGWDRNQVGISPLKRDEIERAIEIVEQLGLNPMKSWHLKPGVRALRGETIDGSEWNQGFYRQEHLPPPRRNAPDPYAGRTFDMPYLPDSPTSNRGRR